MPIHAEDLRRYLGDATGKPVMLRMNNNQNSLISTKRDGAGPGVRVSLHRMFLEADAEVIEALARFIVNPDTEVRRTIRRFINENQHLIREARAFSPPRPVRGTAKGERFDLQERARHLNQQFFDGNLDFRIIWGRNARGSRCRQRHVTLGTWNERQRAIRIHPMLDLPNVPGIFVDYIIFHEMVHIAVPSRTDAAGRMRHHSEEFYALERTFPFYEEARYWEKRWLRKLIRAWNGGRELPKKAGHEVFAES